MNKINNTFNTLNNSTFKQKKYAIEQQALKVINVNEQQATPEHYAQICQQYALQNKWILMINPDELPLTKLSEYKEININNILRVNTKQNDLTLQNIEKALTKGNCSVVVLCNPSLSQAQILQLSKSARQGQTLCIVLNSQQKLH